MSSPAARRAWRLYKRVTPVLDYCCAGGTLAAILLLLAYLIMLIIDVAWTPVVDFTTQE